MVGRDKIILRHKNQTPNLGVFCFDYLTLFIKCVFSLLNLAVAI